MQSTFSCGPEGTQIFCSSRTAVKETFPRIRLPESLVEIADGKKAETRPFCASCCSVLYRLRPTSLKSQLALSKDKSHVFDVFDLRSAPLDDGDLLIET